MDLNEPFSLAEYYKGNRRARRLDVALISLLVLVLLYAPLPFGSVEYTSMALLQAAAAIGFFLWMAKLAVGGNPDQLARFREMHRAETEALAARPFLDRHRWITRLLRIATLGRWPKRYEAGNLVQDTDTSQEAEASHRARFHSLFGYPVRNTGLEALFLLYIGLLFLQLIPLPAFAVRLVSPAAADLYRTAAAASREQLLFHPLSLDPYVTFEKILEYMAYFLLFVLVVNNVRTRILFWIVLYAVFFAAVFQGVYGLYEFLSGHQHIFGYQKVVGLDSASGTFINRNHFAAYLEMSLPLLIALVAGRVRQLRNFRGGFIARIARSLETEGSQILLLILMIVLVAVALVFSLSRSGITFALLSLMTFLFLYWQVRQELGRRAYLTLGICGTVALAVWIGLNPVIYRFLHVSENWAEGARLQVWTDTLDIFLHFPAAGTGAGTFPKIFPMYRSFVYNNVYREAHNDYLQFLSEGGLLVLFLIVAAAEIFSGRLERILARETRRLEIIQIGAFCSLVSVALHSLTDFSLQIPAIAVQASIITGLFFSHYHADHRGSST